MSKDQFTKQIMAERFAIILKDAVWQIYQISVGEDDVLQLTNIRDKNDEFDLTVNTVYDKEDTPNYFKAAREVFSEVQLIGVMHGDRDFTVGYELAYGSFITNRLGWIITIPKSEAGNIVKNYEVTIVIKVPVTAFDEEDAKDQAKAITFLNESNMYHNSAELSVERQEYVERAERAKEIEDNTVDIYMNNAGGWEAFIKDVNYDEYDEYRAIIQGDKWPLDDE